MIYYKIFEVLNLTDLNKTELEHHIRTTIKDEIFMPYSVIISNSCVDHIHNKSESLQKEFSLEKEECDIKYLMYFNCFVDATSFVS